MVRCVALDFGGVMVQINHHWADALAQAGLPRRDLGHLLDFPGHDAVDDESRSDAYFVALGSYLGLEPVEAARVHDSILRSEYPGMHGLVRDLKLAGLTVAGLSNTTGRHVRHMLENFPSVALLDRIVASYDVRLRKPDPAIYAVFEEIIGFGPHEIVFFDDMAANIASAELAGWRAFQVDPKGDTSVQIRSYLQAIRVLR